MTQSDTTSRMRGGGFGLSGCRALLAAAGLVVLGGCSNWDSYLDPSVVGRWEHTATKVPILERIATIEDEPDQYVEYSEIRPSDLIPEAEPYRLGGGDTLVITVYDLIIPGQPLTEQRTIDQNGYIDYPVLGRFYVSGLTEDEVRALIEQRTAEGFVQDPLVSVSLQSRRQQAFHLSGNVRSPGPYAIPASDYRLLEALIAAGGIGESARYVHVIRQVPLTREAGGVREPERPKPDEPKTPSGEELLDIIDDLSGRGAEPLPTRPAERLELPSQPEADEQPEALIDIDEPVSAIERGSVSSEQGVSGGGTRWVFLNGQWVLGAGPTRPSQSGAIVEEEDYLTVAGRLMTQRVIRVPVKPLMAGDARYNIVVRPGDIIRVPLPEAGNIYIDGQINRPGSYQLPAAGRLTLTRAVTAAGGLGGLAIPERVDLTRIVGEGMQATVMLDYRAISEGTQPDIYLKPDDRINIGTNFWAFPLAVLRNGFRVSYGFGFLLDRNFGNDVFGPPPVNRIGN